MAEEGVGVGLGLGLQLSSLGISEHSDGVDAVEGDITDQLCSLSPPRFSIDTISLPLHRSV